jgi:phosphate acyltransferase
MTIILDAMGSDKYPDPEIQGAIDAARQFGEEIVLVGKQDLIEPKLKALNPGSLPVRIHNAPDVLEMGDHVVESAMKKPQNSMAIGMELVKAGQGSCFVTAGSTGAAMFVALRTLKLLPGVQRPALTAIFPTRTGRCVVCDIGANADCRPEFFPQFAVMGSVYAEKVLGINQPRIGLLANGEEAGKGNALVKSSYPMMAASGINFIGNTEPKELFGGHADVVICDGFTGNIMLKSSEAVAKLITDTLKEELMSGWVHKIGALLIRSSFTRVKKLIDPSEVGAAPLLGINGLVFVGHGRSNARAITSAIAVARQAAKVNLLDEMKLAVQEKLSSLQAPSPIAH